VDTSALEPGTVIAGRYRVTGKIGHGGMGAVYEVQHVHTDEALALKVLHPQVLRDGSLVERFRKEARAPARITSEHVARVTDADTAPELDNAPFYVMELLRGRDLERILKDEGPLSPDRVVEYLRQASRALDKAHAMGIVHRDLKPENLFLTHREDGSPCIKLLDFGIARLGDADGVAAPTTQVGYVFGTPNYMAPEQALGDTDRVGRATDVWAMGLVAFKLLVGHEYFRGRATAQIYAQILSEPLTPPSVRGSSFGPDFDGWFSRCVARVSEERFTSVGDAIRALALALHQPYDERSSSSSFLVAPARTGSAPDLPAAPATMTGSGPIGATALPTGLPAGLPARRSVGLLILAGGAVVVLVLGVVAVFRRPTEATTYGLVASASASTASTVAAALSPSSSVSTLASPPLTDQAAALDAGVVLATVGGDSRPRPGAPAKAPGAAGAPTSSKDDRGAPTRDQKKRLDALDRLCSQGTFTPAECQSKRQAILHGGS
jgi:serine/threonine-protein kinase